jgi:hypothetical protein
MLFPSYQVWPYAAGDFQVEIDYRLLSGLISQQYKAALGIKYLGSIDITWETVATS